MYIEFLNSSKLTLYEQLVHTSSIPMMPYMSQWKILNDNTNYLNQKLSTFNQFGALTTTVPS